MRAAENCVFTFDRRAYYIVGIIAILKNLCIGSTSATRDNTSRRVRYVVGGYYVPLRTQVMSVH